MGTEAEGGGVTSHTITIGGRRYPTEDDAMRGAHKLARIHGWEVTVQRKGGEVVAVVRRLYDRPAFSRFDSTQSGVVLTWQERPCPTCHGSGYELDSTGDAVPCGSCTGQDEPDDWQPSAETVAGIEAGAYPF